MTSLVPREAYSQEELEQLYPKDLKLELVQVVCRRWMPQLLSEIWHN